jgi:hypothetical protein
MKLVISVKKFSAASPQVGPTIGFCHPGLPGQELFFFFTKKRPAPTENFAATRNPEKTVN